MALARSGQITNRPMWETVGSVWSLARYAWAHSRRVFVGKCLRLASDGYIHAHRAFVGNAGIMHEMCAFVGLTLEGSPASCDWDDVG